MEGFGHLAHGAPYTSQSILPPLAPPTTAGPSFYSPIPNSLGHPPQPHFSVRPPQDNWLHTNPPTSARYLFPSPSPGPSPTPGPNSIHPAAIPPSIAYGQSMTMSNFLISRHYQPQYPYALIQDNSTSLDVNESSKVLSTSRFPFTAPVGCFSYGMNGGDLLKPKDVNVGTPPSYATPVNQDFSIASIQQQLSGIEPLNESNYTKWRSQIDITLCHLEYDVALLEPKPALPMDTAPEPVKEKYQKWTKANRMCVMIIRGSLCETIRGGIPDTDSAKELMDIIHTQSIRSRKSSIGTTIYQLCTMKFDGQGSVREHILQMEKLVCRLRDLKMEIDDDFLVHMTLNSLPEGFDSVKDKYYSTEQNWDVNELNAHCVQEEVRHRKEKVAKKETLNLEKSEAEKANIVRKANKNLKCYSCGTKGHVVYDCPNNNGTTVQDPKDQHQQPESKTQDKETPPPTTDPEQRDGADKVKFTGCCYRCGKDGHIASACPVRESKKRARQNNAQQSDLLVQCYKCTAYGHYAHTCPKKKKNQGEQSDRAGANGQKKPVQSQGQMDVVL